MDAEIENITKQWKLKNRKLLQKELFDAIDSQIKNDVMPKIVAQGTLSTPEAPVEKYEFRDLKSDLEDMKEFYSTDYPSELVYQKIFEVTFTLSEKLHVVSRQQLASAELLASATLKQTQEAYNELKKDIGEERDRVRDLRHE